MSATNRGSARADLDFYATPAWVTESLFASLPGDIHAGCTILDPCAGDGAILSVIGPTLGRGIEIDAARAEACRQKGLHVRCADALTLPPGSWGNPDAIVMNPPYVWAEPFVRRALQEVKPGGTVAALLRMGFAAGKKRVKLHREFASDMRILPRRPSFTTNGKTDAADYAWFVWPGACRWTVLDPPAKEK